MADRIYDRELECGCLISTDGGGGLMPCHYGYGCGKSGCNEKNECDECKKQVQRCQKAWNEWRKTPDYKEHLKEIKENNK